MLDVSVGEAIKSVRRRCEANFLVIQMDIFHNEFQTARMRANLTWISPFCAAAVQHQFAYIVCNDHECIPPIENTVAIALPQLIDSSMACATHIALCVINVHCSGSPFVQQWVAIVHICICITSAQRSFHFICFLNVSAFFYFCNLGEATRICSFVLSSIFLLIYILLSS